MAYKKTTARKSSRSSTGYSSRKPAARKSASRRKGSTGRSNTTIRIVVEQPQAVSSVGPAPTQSATPAKKAMF